MADDGYDPCECMWNHEMAMRRLLSLLRQSQGYCTDNECLQELPGRLPDSGITSSDSMTMMTMLLGWFIVAAILYYLRPNSIRQDNNGKPQNNGLGPSGTPPAPPSAN